MRPVACLPHLLVFLAVLVSMANAAAQEPAAPRTVNASAIKNSPLGLTSYFSLLEDPGGKLTLGEVQQPEVAARFQSNLPASESLNLGFTESAYWLQLKLHNADQHPVVRMLEIAYARLGDIELHQVDSLGHVSSVQTGIGRPFSSRLVDNRFFVFPLSLLAQSDTTVYLRIQSRSSLLIPARLWSPEAFHTHTRDDYFSQAWYFGIASAMLVFNFFLFLVLRDRNYLLYVGFVASKALTFAAENGLSDQYLWGQYPRWSVIATLVGYSVSLGLFLPFMQRMLELSVNAPRVDRWIRVLTVTLLLSPIAFALSPLSLTLPAILLYLVTVTTVMGTGIFCALKRQRIAYIFLAAYCGLSAGAALYAMRTLGVLPSNALTLNGLQIGSALEMLLLSFALAHRFDLLRREKDLALQAKLDAQRQLVDNLQATERVLEQRVSRRTAELERLNEHLQVESGTDSLTGIANRRRFDETLGVEWARAARSGQPISLAILDIDWFKKYNDHLGHLAGDECLRTVAHHFATHVSRSGDLVARFGGEEFVMLTPATDKQAASTMAHRICQSLAMLAMPHPLSKFSCVTVSIGVATWTPAANEDSSLLVDAADKALYNAKAQGRNQVQCA